MAKKLVQIDESKCSGCGLCADACHEGAIGMVNGKAKLLKKELCDGIGDCLPVCPTGAIAFEENGSRPWPVQIKLVSPAAAFFKEADLLIAADCTAYAYGGFHQEFMKDRVVLIGCPKLDNVDYSEKLAEVLGINDVKSVIKRTWHRRCAPQKRRGKQTWKKKCFVINVNRLQDAADVKEAEECAESRIPPQSFRMS